ncbi:hypothetical protein AB5J56_42575 [Streptomyces sp. R21]|uniref:FXSXX-COOH protein n=1 Tax=Streptomyces sp. R21 TaxID=3238627 RepID=A0AB39PJU5_9ACTN
MTTPTYPSSQLAVNVSDAPSLLAPEVSRSRRATKPRAEEARG